MFSFGTRLLQIVRSPRFGQETNKITEMWVGLVLLHFEKIGGSRNKSDGFGRSLTYPITQKIIKLIISHFSKVDIAMYQ